MSPAATPTTTPKVAPAAAAPSVTYDKFLQLCKDNKVAIAATLVVPGARDEHGRPFEHVLQLSDKEVAAVYQVLEKERGQKPVSPTDGPVHRILLCLKVRSFVASLDPATREALCSELGGSGRDTAYTASRRELALGPSQPRTQLPALNPHVGVPALPLPAPWRQQQLQPFPPVQQQLQPGPPPPSLHQSGLRKRKAPETLKSLYVSDFEFPSGTDDEEDGARARAPGLDVLAMASAVPPPVRVGPTGVPPLLPAAAPRKTGRKGFVRLTVDDANVPEDSVYIHRNVYKKEVRVQERVLT